MFDIEPDYLVIRIPMNMLSDGSKSAMLQGLLFNPKRPRKRKRAPRIFLPNRLLIFVPLEAVRPPFPIFTYEDDNVVVRLAVKKLFDVSKCAIQDSLLRNIGSVVEAAASVEAAATNLIVFCSIRKTDDATGRM
jgi:hypothetical protein